MKLGRAIVLVLTAFLAQASAAYADPSRDLEARKSFELGSKLYGEGAFREALSAFQRAFELDPRPNTLQNVAQCYRDLREFANAYETYEELIRRFGSQLKQDKLEAAKKAVDELALVTAAVRVTISEPDAHVSLDGKDIGTAPFARPIRVSVGEHTIVVTRDGFAPLVRKQEIRGGETLDVTGPLQHDASGRVKVTSTGDPMAKLFVDDRVVGPVPWEGPLPAGEHHLQVRGNGTASLPWLLDIVAEQSQAIELDVAAQRAKLVITTAEPRALIFVDEVAVARGVWEGPVPIGRHRIDVHGPKPTHREVSVADGEVLRVSLDGDAAPRESGSSTTRTLGFVGLGAGVVGLGIGVATGIMALGKSSDLKKACPTGTCFGAAKGDVDSYDTLSTVSTVGVIAGVALAGAGTLAVVLSPRSRSPEVGLHVRVGPGGVFAAGTW